jgi:hypothetical protein
MTCEKHKFKRLCKVPGSGECIWCDQCIFCGAYKIEVYEQDQKL